MRHGVCRKEERTKTERFIMSKKETLTMSHNDTIVIGHKNPDTDSICSAICYARYKEMTTGER